MANKRMLDLVPIWRQRNKYRSENETSTLASVGSSHIRLDSDFLFVAFSFFGHTTRDSECELVKCMIHGVSGKLGVEGLRRQTVATSQKCMPKSMEQITRDSS